MLLDRFENIKLKNVIFSYTKDSTKIKIPEFILKKGDKISIEGESGQGKDNNNEYTSRFISIRKKESYWWIIN